jgi:hypothetical protein
MAASLLILHSAYPALYLPRHYFIFLIDYVLYAAMSIVRNTMMCFGWCEFEMYATIDPDSSQVKLLLKDGIVRRQHDKN